MFSCKSVVCLVASVSNRSRFRLSGYALRSQRFTAITGVPTHKRGLVELKLDYLKKYRVLISLLCGNISKGTKYLSKARESYIGAELWSKYVNDIRRTLIVSPDTLLGVGSSFEEFTDRLDKIVEKEPRYLLEHDSKSVEADTLVDEVEADLFERIFQRAERDLYSSIVSYKALCHSTDLREPHDWYPYARLLKRKVFYHGGINYITRYILQFIHIILLFLRAN
jgi:hypothetical protein